MESRKKTLLILTQAVDRDDPVLGFFHRWIEEFAKHFDSITVICLKEGAHTLPPHVKILSLGKETGVSRLRYVIRFFRYILQERHSYDSVFVHMNPEYLVLGGALWRLMGKRVGFWYTHRQVSWRLRIAALFAHSIFSAAPESFRLKNKKTHFVGHGIDTKKFGKDYNPDKPFHEPLRLISVGRITPIKNLDVFLEALSFLKMKNILFEASIWGAPAVSSDQKYLDMLQRSVLKLNLQSEVRLPGKSALDMPSQYAQSDILVNLTPTGGVDKVVLEAMAAGVLPLSSNQAFGVYFGEHASLLLFRERDAQGLADTIGALVQSKDIRKIRMDLKKKVEDVGGVERIIKTIVTSL